VRYDLDTEEGQYKAGLYCAKNYWNLKLTARISTLETRALIYRLYDDSSPEALKKYNEKNNCCCLCVPRSNRKTKKMLKSWELGIEKGIEIRGGA
jgi:hypothetical protein